jgi:hypothetical protein
VPSGVDPHEVLGVGPGAPAADVTAAYRRLAKRWHPDREPSPGAADRMALINAAYDELRGATDAAAGGAPRPGYAPGPVPSWPRPGEGPSGRPAGGRPGTPPRAGDAPGSRTADGPRPAWAPGPDGRPLAPDDAWGPPPAPDPSRLPPAVRRALGAELRSALQPGEEVGIVVPVTTWASPQTTLAVTDRRVLWLLDDAPVHRVRVLPLAELVDVRVRPPRLWRPRAQVVCTDRRGRRTVFGELAPATAGAVARRMRRPAAAGAVR